jgi:prevent-host-death family protein
MESVQLKDFRNNIDNYFTLVCDDKEEVFITGKNRKAVMLDADNYSALLETL